MKNRFRINWTIANAMGLSFGFLAFIQTLMFYAYGLNFEMHWDFEATNNLPQEPSFLINGLMIGLPIFGLVFSTVQSLALRKYLKSILPWLLSGPIGFILVIFLILPFTKIWGHIEGPVEPFTLVFGGTFLMALIQWWYLKRKNVSSIKSYLFFVLGIIVGILLVYLFFQLGLNVSWPVEVAIIGLIVGGSAGLISSKHFLRVLSKL